MACRGIRNGSPFLGSSGDESVDRWSAEESPNGPGVDLDEWSVISDYEESSSQGSAEAPGLSDRWRFGNLFFEGDLEGQVHVRCSTPKPGSPSENWAEGLADLGWQPGEDGIWRLPVAEWSSDEETGGWQKRDSTFEAANRSNRMIGWSSGELPSDETPLEGSEEMSYREITASIGRMYKNISWEPRDTVFLLQDVGIQVDLPPRPCRFLRIMRRFLKALTPTRIIRFFKRR